MVRNKTPLMSDFEIAKSYRLTKNKEKQIGILAQLNSISKEKIREIIKEETKKEKKEDRHYRLMAMECKKRSSGITVRTSAPSSLHSTII